MVNKKNDFIYANVLYFDFWAFSKQKTEVDFFFVIVEILLQQALCYI